VVPTVRAIETRAKTPLIHIVWEFIVRDGRISAFERHYGAEGTWAELFRGSQGYRGTILWRDKSDPRRYLTVDAWDSREAFEEMKARVAKEYARLDGQCADLTDAENYLGTFENA